jgi:hypothetical protein
MAAESDRYAVAYQHADQRDILRAATASGGNMVEYFLEDDDLPDGGMQN